MSDYTGLEIAITGMAGRFPGANHLQAFWDNLSNGVESVEFFSKEDLLAAGESADAIDHPSYVRANSFVKDKEYFDASFFGYLPSEAALMDPQMRIFHEVCWHALEDAGCNPYDGSNKIGLFAGGASNVNWITHAVIENENNLVDDFTAFNLRDVNFLCSHISYLFDFQGPSINCNTACSTSLVAVQRACMSLLLRECNVALAGGVFISSRPRTGYLYQEGMIHSSDGHCRAFDEAASGTIIGDGAGVVVLKRLQDAIKDGDHIYAVIKGSAVNNDGYQKIGFTAPSVEGQSKVISKAIQMAQVDPSSITYVEAHGTGTVLGL
jgi:iturin family lipopeptide synthetase A